MRFLPYLLVAAMAAPVFFWILVEKFMVKGSSAAFSTGDVVSLGTLAVVMVIAFGLLSRWMDKFIVRTGG